MTQKMTRRLLQFAPAFSHEYLGISTKSQQRQRRMSLRTMLLHVGLAMGLVAILVEGCAQNPVSGRPEVSLVSAEKEREIGAELARKVEQIMGLVEDPELVAYVEAIGGRLAQHSPRKDVEYAFYVVDMVQPNAFALPGGYVYISRGLLPLVNSEDELASVIAHEIAHVAARHAVQRVNVAAATAPVRIVTGITGLATSIVSPRLGQMVAGAGQAASALVLAPYSRDQERQADRIGQELAARAGWDPRGIATFLETLNRDEKLRSGESSRYSFFATHPSTPDRVTRTVRYASDLTATPAEPISKDHADLLARFDGLLIGENPAEGVFTEGRFLQPSLDFTLLFPPKWETQNAPTFAAAKAPEEDALILLQVVEAGDDPLQVVRSLEEKVEFGLLENAQQTPIDGLNAVRSVITVRTSDGKIGLDLTWIAHKGLIYQITAMSPIARFDTYRTVFLTTAMSFRPLSAAERAGIQATRLRIASAQGEETLGQLIERVNGAWTTAEAAVANAIQEDARLRPGQLIKVPIREPYMTPARPPTPSD